MAPSINNSKRKTILPLHIDTASFTNQQSNVGFSFWRRLNNKRQLPIFVLLTFLFFSLFLNLMQHHAASKKAVFPTTASKYNALPPPPLSDKSSRAIVVAGHAIYHGPLIVSELSSDANWVLESFQKGGQVNTFVQHIQKGIDILKEDPEAVLIFSG
jgi:hypothetical protein